MPEVNHKSGLNQDVKPDRHSSTTVLFLLIFVLICGVICYVVFHQPQQEAEVAGGKREADALEGSLNTMTDEEIQEELNKIVDEGMFRISIASTILAVEDGMAEVRIENHRTNRYVMKVQIYLDDTGEEIYASDLIDPGYYIQETTLDQQLAPGEYAATAVFTGLYPDTEEIVGTVGAQVVIRVLEKGTDLDAVLETMTETEQESEANTKTDTIHSTETVEKEDVMEVETETAVFQEKDAGADQMAYAAGTDVYLNVSDSPEQDWTLLSEDIRPVYEQNGKDLFLVFDKNYNPADYRFTEYSFSEEDLEKESGESDGELLERQARYMLANPSTILIETLLEYPSQEESENRIKPDETTAYGQRSLMLPGPILFNWIRSGYKNVVFVNDNAGVRVDLSALYEEQMETVYENLYLEAHSLDSEVSMPNEWFETFLQESVLEFCITPIRRDELIRILEEETEPKEGSAETEEYQRDNSENPEENIEEDSKEDSNKKDRERMADGFLTDAEYELLWKWMADKQASNGALTREEAKQAIEQLFPDRLYRISCRLHYGGAAVDVTENMKNLIYLQKAEGRVVDTTLPLIEAYRFLMITEQQQETDETSEDTQKSETEEQQEKTIQVSGTGLLQSLPEPDNEFYELLSTRTFPAWTVDVKQTEADFQADITEAEAVLLPQRALAALVKNSGLIGLQTMSSAQ
jgi:hypothetical protein